MNGILRDVAGKIFLKSHRKNNNIRSLEILLLKEKEHFLDTFAHKVGKNILALNGVNGFFHFYPFLNRSINDQTIIGERLWNEHDGHLVDIFRIFSMIKKRLYVIVPGKVLDIRMPHPFLFISSSSGIGKSELPFAFSNKYSVFYFLFDYSLNGPQSMQDIYRNVENISHAFKRCVDKDLMHPIISSNDLFSESLFHCNVPLFTYGLVYYPIVKFLENRHSDENRQWAELLQKFPLFQK